MNMKVTDVKLITLELQEGGEPERIPQLVQVPGLHRIQYRAGGNPEREPIVTASVKPREHIVEVRTDQGITGLESPGPRVWIGRRAGFVEVEAPDVLVGKPSPALARGPAPAARLPAQLGGAEDPFLSAVLAQAAHDVRKVIQRQVGVRAHVPETARVELPKGSPELANLHHLASLFAGKLAAALPAALAADHRQVLADGSLYRHETNISGLRS